MLRKWRTKSSLEKSRSQNDSDVNRPLDNGKIKVLKLLGMLYLVSQKTVFGRGGGTEGQAARAIYEMIGL